MTEVLVRRVRDVAGAVFVAGVALAQAPGQVVPDTKLDLVLDPGGFLARALQAWDPQAAFGQLQNQAYGYLFPMGPFFWLGHAVGLPAWVVQRLWWVALLLVAYLGFLRLARELGMGGEVSRVVAAVGYALGPRVITVLGAISVEALPLAVLPWVLVPLVRGAREGSPRRAAALSALAVACIGGVNAAATLAVLVTPLVFVLTRAPGPRRNRLLLWWLGCTGLAVSWWLLPLVVLGRFAYPFLDVIETASATTSVTSATNVLRGADHWLGHLVENHLPAWPAGFEVAGRPAVAAATVIVAGLGLAGIAARATPERRFLGWSVLAGVTLVGAGYDGAGGAPLAGPVQALLDGALAAFRNVHKFDPVLRLPLTLGLAAALARTPELGRRVAALVPGPEGAWLRARPVTVARVAAGVALAAVTVSMLPAVGGRLAPPGSFDEVPAEWAQAARWLSDHDPDGGRTLLLPASRFGDYTWGRPADEPFQGLARSPWGVRNAVPLGAPGATRVLDAVEAEVALGRGSELLAPALARVGVRHVLLRNDLDRLLAGTPPPVARATLLGSPGLTKVAGFGGPPDPEPWHAVTGGAQPPGVDALEVFEVAQAGAPVTLLAGDAVGLSGGSEATLDVAAALLGVPLVAVADGGPTDVALVTDTLRRRAKAFDASTPRDYTPTLGARDDVLRGRPAGDVLPYAGPAHETVRELHGARAVQASTAASEPGAERALGPAYRPAAAFDGDASTAWVSDVRDAEPTLRVLLDRPQAVRSAVVFARQLPSGVPVPLSVTVTTDSGRASAPFVDGVARVALPAGSTESVRLRLVPGGDGASGTGITDVAVDGLGVLTESLRVPTDAMGGAATLWSFARQPGARRACLLPGPEWVCQPGLARAGEERELDRAFTVADPTSAVATVAVVPRQGAALEALVDAALGVRVTASSRAVADLATRPGAAFDGDPATAWVARPSDPRPTLTVTYPAEVTVSGLRLAASEATARRLDAVVVRSGGQTRTVEVGPDGTAGFAPLRGDRFSVSLVLGPGDGEPGQPTVSQVRLHGAPSPAADSPVVVPCGAGPALRLDGRTYHTVVRTTVRAVVGGSAVPAELCTDGEAPAAALALTRGEHRLTAVPSGAFDVERVRLAAPGAAVARPAAAVGVRRWDAEHRIVQLDGTGGLLTLAEGFNPGWVASTGGRTLEPVRVDGWRQAWRVPAGTTGDVVLEFRPGRLHRAGLLLGLLGVLGVIALAGWPARRRAVAPAPAGTGRRLTADLAPLVVALTVAGWAGLAGWAWARALAGRRPVAVVGVGAMLLAGVLAVRLALRGAGWWVLVLEQVLAVGLVVSATRPALASAAGANPRGARAAGSAPPAGATTRLPLPASRPS